MPILVDFVGHTATSTPEEVAAYRDRLSVAAERRSASGGAAALRSTLDPDAWHGHLLHPEYGAGHLKAALALRSLVRRTGDDGR